MSALPRRSTIPAPHTHLRRGSPTWLPVPAPAPPPAPYHIKGERRIGLSPLCRTAASTYRVIARTASSPLGSQRGRSAALAISVARYSTIREMRAALSVSIFSTWSVGRW